MGLEGGKKRKAPVENAGSESGEQKRKLAQAALRVAILGYLALHPDGGAADKREASRISEGYKMSHTTKQESAAEGDRSSDPQFKYVKWIAGE